MGNARGEKRDFEALSRRRMRAGRLFEQGMNASEVSRRVGVVRQTASRWYADWAKRGVIGLRGAGRAGRKSRLTDKQREKVVVALKAGAMARGYSNELWTTKRIAKVIKEVTGIEYHQDHIGRLLKQLGWSCQRPERRARERDEQKIALWKKKTWPSIKKKPETNGER